MPENFITMLGILSIFLLSGFVFGCIFTRNRSKKTLQEMQAKIETRVKQERGDLSLEFASELASLRSNLLGVARSYDGALRLIKENLPDDVDLSRSLPDGNRVPAELGFGSARSVGRSRMEDVETEVPQSEETSHVQSESVRVQPERSEEKMAQIEETSQSEESKSELTVLDESVTKEKVEPSEDSKVQLSSSDDSEEEESRGFFADNDSPDHLKNGRISSS